MINQQRKDIIIQEIKLYNPNKIGIFGSYARDENNMDSDLDILVSFVSDITLFDLIGIEQGLSDKLGLKVDLVTERSLSKKIESFVYQNLKYIYKV